LAFRRAAWAQTMVAGAPTDLFEIQKAADGVYFAFARPQAVTNCNAAIFVNSADVLVVDAHSKPSAAAGLIAQIRRQITPKPVRYLVDSHFHWDHSQGNAAYRNAFGKDLNIIASRETKRLEAQFSESRLRESLDPHDHPFSGQPHIPILSTQPGGNSVLPAPRSRRRRSRNASVNWSRFNARCRTSSPCCQP
jgi:glyoxylase-like metal-dependent hydrolase (beta-lactamase superfamily II)